jgi:SNF2 family DNA or RNA helicase
MEMQSGRDAEALAVFTALRQIGADYKLPAAAALVGQLQAQGESVVLFCSFVASAQLLQDRLGGQLLTGQVPPHQRQSAVDAFQAGASRLLIATYGAGGLGFSLQRARHVVLLERPWTPGDTEQAEDRCHRIGMEGSLTSHWLQLGVADQLVDALIASKAERIALLLQRRPLQLRRQGFPAMVKALLADW